MIASAIAPAGVPVLCVDTCSLLDILRDPTRPKSRAHEHQAAIDLVAAAEGGRLACICADLVFTEFAMHDQNVQRETEKTLKKMREQVGQVNAISAVYGAIGAPVNFAHLDGYVARVRVLVDRWFAQLGRISPSLNAHERAFSRVIAGRAPATRGKESSKDCLICETYLEVVASLRREGTLAPVVFLSSNTEEYLTESKVLKQEIEADFSSVKLRYAQNMSVAKHILGL